VQPHLCPGLGGVGYHTVSTIFNTKILCRGNFGVGTRTQKFPNSSTFRHAADMLPTCRRHVADMSPTFPAKARIARAARARGPGQGRMRDKVTTKDRAVDINQEGGKGWRGNRRPPHGCNCKGQAGVVLSLRWGGGTCDHCFWCDGRIGWRCLYHRPHGGNSSSDGQPGVIHTSRQSPPLPRCPVMHSTITPIGEPTTGPILCFHHYLLTCT
jgi:hypothetical protein